VVTASGETLDLDRGLEKNNTGVDLLHLFIGSEGILGIITAATLKLAPLPRRTDLALVGAPSLAAVLRVFREARWETLTLSAFEVFSDACLARVRRHRGLESPLSQPAPFLALIEVENDHEGRLAGWIDRTMRQGILTDGVMAQSPRQAEELWALRENISESLTATGLPHKNDVSVPVAQLSPFTSDLGELVRTRYAGLEVLVYGHVGDGNLHVNTMKPEEMSPEEFTARTREVDRDLFELVRRHRGSISAEHGIGLLKKDYLSYTRSPAEIDLLKQLKRTLDPQGILNPGKVLDV
jgi:FAD/FMN-containing dehydrogenase